MACGPTELPSESAGSETAGSGSGSAGETETGGEEGCPTPAEFCRGTPLDLEAVAAGDGGFAVVGDEAPEALGDVNGDGLDDLGFAGFVVFSEPEPGALVDDPGALAARGFAVTWSEPLEPPRVVGAGDVNGDSLADMIAVDGESGRAWVLFGKADLAPVVLEEVSAGEGGYALDGVNAFAARLDDVNGDGFADLALRPVETLDATIVVLPGKADGAPVDVAAAPVLETVHASMIRAADLDGDGIVELALCGAGDGLQLEVLSAPSGWEEAARSAAVVSRCWAWSAIEVEDLDGDGVVDISVLEAPSLGGYVRWLYLGPVTAIEPPPIYPEPYVHCGQRGCALADVNGDGVAELVGADDSFHADAVNVAWVAPLTTLAPVTGAHAETLACAGSTATLTTALPEQSAQLSQLFEPLGDVNGDGRVDLYLRDASVVITRVCDLPSGGDESR